MESGFLIRRLKESVGANRRGWQECSCLVECLLRMRSHSETCCRFSVETGRARIEPSDNDDSALLEAFDDAKRVRPARRARQREERRERHARSLFPRISGTLSALLARITHRAVHTQQLYESPLSVFLSMLLSFSLITLLSLLEFSSINRSQLLSSRIT